MESLTITHFIPKSAEGSYYTIQFSVPDKRIERLSVSYRYDRKAGQRGRFINNINIVDLGLMDSNGRFLGWSGSARASIFVGPYSATQGYLMTEISAGQWQLLVGAYKIPTSGLEVHYEISFTPQQPRWMAGDLHMHSTASDGKHDIYSLAKMAKQEGLDFIAVSNHNNYSENYHLPVEPGLTFIPAVEWTHYRGHMNFYGVSNPFENSFVANDEQQMQALIESAKEKGALVAVNHPKCNICPYLWQDSNNFDLIEVWNGPMRKVNLNGIAWWHGLLKQGRKIPIVGGSDFHKKWHIVRLAHPVNHVYSNSPTAADILDAISKGHNYVSASIKGVQLDLKYGSHMMGDTVRKINGELLSISACHLKPGMVVKLINQTGIIAQWQRFNNGILKAELAAGQSWRFAYLIASFPLFGMDYVRAITNPIYFDQE